MSTPFFSIIIPTHQRSNLLRRAIESVRASGYEDCEVIVVSDSTDRDTMAVAADLLRGSDTFVKRQGAPGPAPSRNLGMDLARGERILFLDDDDSIDANYLSQLQQQCLKSPRNVIYTNFRVVEEDRSLLSAAPINAYEHSVKASSKESLYIKNFLSFNGVTFPTAQVRNKRQDPHLGSLEDWDFLLNVAQDSSFEYIDMFGPVVHKDYVNTGNRRGSSAAAKGLQVISDYLSIYKKWPAPTPELKQQRQDFIAGTGFRPPLEWL